MDKKSLDRARFAGSDSYRVSNAIREAAEDWVGENFPDATEYEHDELVQEFEGGVFGS